MSSPAVLQAVKDALSTPRGKVRKNLNFDSTSSAKVQRLELPNQEQQADGDDLVQVEKDPEVPSPCCPKAR